tara:strand:- start:197 stop:1156 length:960 start_codon:yes stop_codon:yes gene_type:complete
MALTDDIKTTEDMLLFEALKDERAREEEIYRGRSLLGASLESFAGILGNVMGRKDAEGKIALAGQQIDEINEKMATPVEVNIDDAEDKAVLDKLGRDISSAAAMNPTQSAQLFGEYEQLKEKSLDKSRIDAETARLSGEAEKTAALLPAKQDAEMQKLLAEQEKPGVLDDVAVGLSAGATLAAAGRPKTAQREFEDLAERKNTRAGKIDARIKEMERKGEDTTDLAAKLAKIKKQGQTAAKKANTIQQQRYKNARLTAGLDKPETFGTNLSNLMTPAEKTKSKLDPFTQFKGLETPDSLAYNSQNKRFPFGTGTTIKAT